MPASSGASGPVAGQGRTSAADWRQLEVSQRTVLRDIEALSAAGFPVYALRGSRGGFELLTGSSVDLPAVSPQLRQDRPGGTSRRARLRLSPHGRRLAALSGRPAGLRVRRRGQRPAGGRTGWVEAWLPLTSLSTAAADMLALGADAEVIEPIELRDLVRQTALEIAELHRGTAAREPAKKASDEPTGQPA